MAGKSSSNYTARETVQFLRVRFLRVKSLGFITISKIEGG